MKLIIVDNIEWSGFEKHPDVKSFICTKNMLLNDVKNKFENIKNNNESILYLINVHCVIKPLNSEKVFLQDQYGVELYRLLLKVYEKKELDLKVAFFSPISLDTLVSLKPQNIVIKQHDFFSIPFDFEVIINLIKTKDNWKYFNNSSENLLSGWGVFEQKRIDLKSKKILVIDDEWKLWETVFDTVFKNKEVDFFLSTKSDIKTHFKKLKNNEFDTQELRIISKYDLVISDLYLWENHEVNTWKTDNVIKEISGFKLFKLIRENEPSIPIVFHTTSSKFRIYEELIRLGSDGQIPKNINHQLSNDEKKDTFSLFYNTLDGILKPFSDCWINDTYRLVREYDANQDNEADFSHFLVALILYKQFNKKDYFSKYLNIESSDVVSASIIIELWAFLEQNSTRYEGSKNYRFIKKLRNHCAHINESIVISLDLVIISFVLVEHIIKEKNNVALKWVKYPFFEKKQFLHPLFELVSYFNKNSVFIDISIKDRFIISIKEQFDLYIENRWEHYSIEEKSSIINNKHVKRFFHTLSPKEIIFENDKCFIK